MKLTEQSLRNMIKEELQTILNEKTVRFGDMDLIFQGKNKVQLLSNKGRTGLTRMDVKMIISAVKKYIGGIF
jgi:hypothetical protein